MRVRLFPAVHGHIADSVRDHGPGPVAHDIRICRGPASRMEISGGQRKAREPLTGIRLSELGVTLVTETRQAAAALLGVPLEPTY
jgi:hypothetical protein